jgi:secreted trypsin-like serine protease
VARRRFDAVLALAASLVAGSLVAACDGGAPPGVVSQPIINGVEDDGDPAVVLLALGSPNGYAMPLCSGEVVSPHVILTAAHCISPTTVGPDAPIEVFTGTKIDPSATADQFLFVAEKDVVPTFGYNPDTGGDADDLGVLVLRGATTIAPIPFNHFALPRGFDGQTGRIVGYGLTSPSDNALVTAGTRRQAPTALFAVNEDDTLTLYDRSHSICNGDSGGPAFFMLDGSEQIAGVSREVYVGCPVDKGAIDTRTDAWADFIDTHIAAVDGPLPLGGGACATNADCAPYVCGDTSAGRMCERPCDPQASPASTCVAGTVCRVLDGKTMCAPPAPRGCSVGGGDFRFAVLLVLVWASYRQARRRVLTTVHADSSRAARDRPLPEV